MTEFDKMRYYIDSLEVRYNNNDTDFAKIKTQIKKNILNNFKAMGTPIRAISKEDKLFSEELLKEINKYFKVDIRSKSRKREVSYPRIIYSYILKRKTKLTLQAIANYSNLKNHATIIYHGNKINDIIEFDKSNPIVKDILYFMDKYQILL